MKNLRNSTGREHIKSTIVKNFQNIPSNIKNEIELFMAYKYNIDKIPNKM